MPPSPTGHLHIGTARTALFNYLFARKNGGKMILRMEDTDKARSKKEYETEIIEGLRLLGLTWDNETVYRQSERSDLYKRYLDKAVADGHAYVSNEPSKNDPNTMVSVVRLKNPNKTITFTDLIRGDITFDTTELGDIVIARSIDDALYHFAVVVDDFEMGITHVLRGEDHISNTPRQILIQEAIGAPRPLYVHMPLILAPDKSKLSKRHGAVAVYEYLEEGFLPEALINYLALLGWNPGTDQEIFTLPELIETFSVERIQKSGAIWNREKLLWVNKQHLLNVPKGTLVDEIRRRLPERLTKSKHFNDRFPRLLPTICERISIYSEVADAAQAGEYNFIFSSIDYGTELLKWKNDDSIEKALPRLEKASELLQNAKFGSIEGIKEAVWPYAEEVGRGELLWPLRIALTGLERSPDPFTCAYILGKEETLSRIQIACDKIKG